MTTQKKIIKNKLGVLELAQHLGNVSRACKVMSYSRDSFYRFKKLYDQRAELALQKLSRRKPVLKKLLSFDLAQADIPIAKALIALKQYQSKASES